MKDGQEEREEKDDDVPPVRRVENIDITPLRTQP